MFHPLYPMHTSVSAPACSCVGHGVPRCWYSWATGPFLSEGSSIISLPVLSRHSFPLSPDPGFHTACRNFLLLRTYLQKETKLFQVHLCSWCCLMLGPSPKHPWIGLHWSRQAEDAAWHQDALQEGSCLCCSACREQRLQMRLDKREHLHLPPPGEELYCRPGRQLLYQLQMQTQNVLKGFRDFTFAFSFEVWTLQGTPGQCMVWKEPELCRSPGNP